ncbi:aberrant root formation protein 4 isoform X2 [Cryptomeria japonica]|uniref:aberrant root formation protein 4 isoform X2 n=1 Tax=Cryptomeria japonica TaxID=3369 RepID=UPI0025AD2B98|nr:aberrant root formation protein 4 isoform X2 [Cryptomeria japonica]
MANIEEIRVAKYKYLRLLNEAALRCYQNYGTEAIQGSEFLRVLEDAVKFLKTLPLNEESSDFAYEILRETQSLTITNPKGQVLLDMVSLDLPRVILTYMDISEKCWETCGNVITHMCQFCSPSEIVSVLCEELSKTNENLSSSIYLLHGFSIASIMSDDDSKDVAAEIFKKLINIAVSLREVCKKQVVAEKKQQLWSILSLYTLQLMALVSKEDNITDLSRAPTSIMQLSEILSDCGLSYLSLITGKEVETICHLLDNDEHDKILENTSLINIGANLAVLWGYVFVEIATVAHENIKDLLKKIQSCQNERIRALSNMKYLLCSLDYPWGVKKISMDFLSAMLSKNSDSSKGCDEKIDWFSTTPSLFSLLQGMQQIMVYAPHPMQRKEAFSALTKILGELPAHEKFDVLRALTVNSNYPSMTALLLGTVKNEIDNAIKLNSSKYEHSHLGSPFLTGDVLELVEFILKPLKGGPPDLPGQSDAVLAALNLYRFLLIMESTGKTNYTGVLSKSCLKKAHSEWLLPLRALVSGIESENANDCDDFATSTLCALNLIELPLYRCLELVEEKLKHPA